MKPLQVLKWFTFFAILPMQYAAELTNPSSIGPNYVWKIIGESGLTTNTFKASEALYYVIIPTKTNGLFYRTFPDDQSLQFRLLGENDLLVQKTELGFARSHQPIVPQTTTEAAKLHGYSLSRSYTLFSADKMFVITNAGTYDLEVLVSIWAQVTNRLPSNEIMARFDKSISSNAFFGLVVSEPIRVKIIK